MKERILFIMYAYNQRRFRFQLSREYFSFTGALDVTIQPTDQQTDKRVKKEVTISKNALLHLIYLNLFTVKLLFYVLFSTNFYII